MPVHVLSGDTMADNDHYLTPEEFDRKMYADDAPEYMIYQITAGKAPTSMNEARESIDKIRGQPFTELIYTCRCTNNLTRWDIAVPACDLPILEAAIGKTRAESCAEAQENCLDPVSKLSMDLFSEACQCPFKKD